MAQGAKKGKVEPLSIETHLTLFDSLYFDVLRHAVRYVTEIVRPDVDESTEAIISVLDDHLAQHEDDTWYSFHEFEEVNN